MKAYAVLAVLAATLALAAAQDSPQPTPTPSGGGGTEGGGSGRARVRLNRVCRDQIDACRQDDTCRSCVSNRENAQPPSEITCDAIQTFLEQTFPQCSASNAAVAALELCVLGALGSAFNLQCGSGGGSTGGSTGGTGGAPTAPTAPTGGAPTGGAPTSGGGNTRRLFSVYQLPDLML
eukprot:TRINITY_DN516_c0_g1_i1.p1 TRINITY_DN516_c0_g1~~TRINITY_DN516_c0_g1_i1.p1  ORF type:complete len:178 (+),score=55.76 TRINITY_DN516_c0_g1_i1:176-709(+)